MRRQQPTRRRLLLTSGKPSVVTSTDDSKPSFTDGVVPSSFAALSLASDLTRDGDGEDLDGEDGTGWTQAGQQRIFEASSALLALSSLSAT